RPPAPPPRAAPRARPPRATLERLLPLDVQATRRYLEQVRIRHGLARLAHQPHPLGVVGHDPHGALVADDLALDLLAVGVAEALDAHVHQKPVIDRLAPQRLEGSRRARAHPPSPSPSPSPELSSESPCSDSSASAEPPASAAAKNRGSSLRERPIVSVESPLTA